jgi:hypothetical protein
VSARQSKREQKEVEDALAARIEAELDAELGEPGQDMNRAERRAWERWVRKDRRVRFSKQLPKPPLPGEVEVLYAKLREELNDLNGGEAVMLVMGSQAWEDTVGARCRELDAAASDSRRYDHMDDEKFLLWMRFEGVRDVKTAHEKLQGYTQRFDREAMGFNDSRPDHVKTRHVKDEKNRQMDGIPSRAEISRHKKTRFLEAERDALYPSASRASSSSTPGRTPSSPSRCAFAASTARRTSRSTRRAGRKLVAASICSTRTVSAFPACSNGKAAARCIPTCRTPSAAPA